MTVKHKMMYEAFKDKVDDSGWRVEALNMKEGDCYVTIFSGPLAQERAEEYAEFKNLQ